MNIGVRVYIGVLVFFRYMLRNGIPELYVSSIFSFLRNFHVVLHSDCTNSLIHSNNDIRLIDTNSVGGFLFLHTLNG